MKRSKDAPLGYQVTFRVPKDLKRFYEQTAKKESKKISDLLRTALEQHKEVIEERQQAA